MNIAIKGSIKGFQRLSEVLGCGYHSMNIVHQDSVMNFLESEEKKVVVFSDTITNDNIFDMEYLLRFSESYGKKVIVIYDDEDDVRLYNFYHDIFFLN